MALLLLSSLFICGCLGQLDVCGRPPLNTSIVGGQDAPAGSWPWQVSIHFFGEPLCGGSLINKEWVLSAAQCFFSISAGDLEVYLGRQNQEGSNPNEVKTTVSRIIGHPSYNRFANDNDIALLQLSAPVTFSNYIRPVCLAASDSVFNNGTVSWVIGKGNISEDVLLPSPGTLQEVKVHVIENTQCNSLYEDSTITDNMICAAELARGKDSCQGKLGGPLMSQQDSLWVQSGIVSFGDCAQPRVFTKVSRYQSWINSPISSDQPGFVQLSGPHPPVTMATTFPSTSVTMAASPSTSVPQSRTCHPRAINNIAIPMVTIQFTVENVSANSDLKQLRKRISIEIEKHSKERYTDPLYLKTTYLQISQSNTSASGIILEGEIQQHFQLPPFSNYKICFPGRATVMGVMREAVIPQLPSAQVSFNITNSLSVVVKVLTNIMYEEALSNRTSEEFRNLEIRIVRVIDEIIKTKYGILFKRTTVMGVRPRAQRKSRAKRGVMETEVELQEEFDSASTSSSSSGFPKSSDIVDTLKTAAGNSTLGFRMDLDSITITEGTVSSRAVTCRLRTITALDLIGLSLLILWMWLAN